MIVLRGNVAVTGRLKLKCFKKILSQCHFVHYIFCVFPATESMALPCESSDCLGCGMPLVCIEISSAIMFHVNVCHFLVSGPAGSDDVTTHNLPFLLFMINFSTNLLLQNFST
jgi:hypothetical protein